ncbi:MAG: hypothetical protein ABH816_01985 [Candidatus Levyibacteriota bacterium]
MNLREKAMHMVLAGAIVGALGVGCAPPVREGTDASPSKTKTECLTVTPSERYSCLYKLPDLNFPVWDIGSDGAYYGCLVKNGEKSSISAKINDDTLIIRLARSFTDFAPDFPEDKNLAYIFDPKDMRARTLPFNEINKIVDNDISRFLQARRSSPIIAVKDVWQDSGFVYLGFDYQNMQNRDRYWTLMMRNNMLEGNNFRGVGKLILQAMRIRRASFDKA